MKKSSAETEPAWKGAGQAVGIQIWRIVKFKVSLIIITPPLVYTVNMWLGHPLAQGSVWGIFQWRLLHPPQHLQGERF